MGCPLYIVRGKQVDGPNCVVVVCEGTFPPSDIKVGDIRETGDLRWEVQEIEELIEETDPAE